VASKDDRGSRIGGEGERRRRDGAGRRRVGEERGGVEKGDDLPRVVLFYLVA